MPRLMATASRFPRLRLRAGFTLAELIVALFLFTIIGTATTRVLIKQQQYYKDVNRSSSARRELRLGASVLPAELRSISTSGGDIISMSDSSITMFAYIGSSVICARTATTITLPPHNLVHHKLTSFVVQPQQGDSVFLFDEGLLAGSEDDSWQRLGISAAPATSATACPGAPYTDPLLDLPVTKPRLVYTLGPGNIADSVRVGAVVRFGRRVRYLIYQGSSGSFLGLQENNAGSWAALQAMAGPYRPYVAGDGNPSGLQFRYYDTLGTRITDFTQTTRVGRVDVFLRTNAGRSAITERKGALLRDSVVMRVAVRNSK
jgi:prepilin-type N-terminal cleavage/methylation domain-containing protein